MTALQPLGPRQQALVAALRSGRYVQAREALHTPQGFCCLGVACEISGLGRWVEVPDDRRLRQRFLIGTSPVGETSVLPKDVVDYYGFSNEMGSFRDSCGDQQELTELNDNGTSFRKIADLIEAHSATMFLEPR